MDQGKPFKKLLRLLKTETAVTGIASRLTYAMLPAYIIAALYYFHRAFLYKGITQKDLDYYDLQVDPETPEAKK